MNKCAKHMQKFSDNLKIILDQLSGGQPFAFTSDASSQQELWRKLDGLVKELSFEATKLSLLFCDPPLPSERDVVSLLNKSEQIIVAIVSTYGSLSSNQGQILLKRICAAITDIVFSLRDLSLSIIENNVRAYRLQTTGCVWALCDEFSQLPKNNASMVAKYSEEVMTLVNDAYEEFHMEVESFKEDPYIQECNDSDDLNDPEPQWLTSDSDTLNSSMGLMKTACACLKRAKFAIYKNGKSNDESCIKDLDDIAGQLKQVSPSVDDFALTLYPPINFTSARTEGNSLAANLHNLLHILKSSHIISEDDLSWIDFLSKAIDHNLNKVINSTELILLEGSLKTVNL